MTIQTQVTDASESTNKPYSVRGDGVFDRFLTFVGLRSASNSREDLADAIEDSSRQNLTSQEQAMLRNVLRLGEIRISDVMVPRADIIAVAADETLADLLRLFRTANHSRLPVYGDTLDDPKGMIHIRDFLDHLAAKAEAGARNRRRKKAAAIATETILPKESARDQRALDIDLGAVDLSATIQSAKLVRSVLYVPPSMPAVDLLVRMQATRTHMALVIDEYGGTDGLVSIEDLVEVVVGDIEDEHDEEETATIQSLPDGALILNARATLEDMSAALKIDLSEAAEDVDTVGGYVTTLAGRVPVRGEIVSGPDGLEFEILDADPRRIKRLKAVRRIKSDAEQPKPLSVKVAADPRAGVA